MKLRLSLRELYLYRYRAPRVFKTSPKRALLVWILIACIFGYAFIHIHERVQDRKGSDVPTTKETAFLLTASAKDTFHGSDVLSLGGISLQERLTIHHNKKAPPRLIYVEEDLNTLDGCRDWHCELTSSNDRMQEADAVIISLTIPRGIRQHQYLVVYSQESPLNWYQPELRGRSFNMTIGYRHDSPVASPYGYTVKLAKGSRANDSILRIPLLKGKRKGAAWFVSNCRTHSRREEVVRELKVADVNRERFDVHDIYPLQSELLVFLQQL